MYINVNKSIYLSLYLNETELSNASTVWCSKDLHICLCRRRIIIIRCQSFFDTQICIINAKPLNCYYFSQVDMIIKSSLETENKNFIIWL